MPPLEMSVPSPLLASLLAKLEPFRDRLIDISLRNRLLNYKDLGGKNLLLQPLDLDTLYSRLVDDGVKFEIQGTPQPKEETIELPLGNPPPALEFETPPSRKRGSWGRPPANVPNTLWMKRVQTAPQMPKEAGFVLKTVRRRSKNGSPLFKHNTKITWNRLVPILCIWRLDFWNGLILIEKVRKCCTLRFC